MGAFVSSQAAVAPGEYVPSWPPKKPTKRVVFVLGGPGSGKGTQCAKIVDEFGFTHLSAGDLLRAEIKSGSEQGNMIQAMIKEGKIVPAEVTVGLLKAAMESSENDKFLIDGFPRNLENKAAYDREIGIVPDMIVVFDCPEEVLEKRLLGRNQGRIDDNIESIRKRFRVFVEESMPVINSYNGGFPLVHKIDGTQSAEQVFLECAKYLVSYSFKPKTANLLLPNVENAHI